MAAAGVDAGGAVVVPAPDATIAPAPTSADPNFSHVARPVNQGGDTAIPPAESPSAVIAAAVVVPSQQAPSPTSTPPVAPAESPPAAATTSTPPVSPTAEPQVVSTPVSTPPVEAAPVQPAPLPSQEAPAQPSPQAPAEPSEPLPEVAPPAEPSSQAEAINGANVFAPEVEVDQTAQEQPAPSSEPPPAASQTAVNNAAVDAPSPSPSPADGTPSASSQRTSASTGSSSSSRSSSTSGSATSSRASDDSASNQAEASVGGSTAPDVPTDSDANAMANHRGTGRDREPDRRTFKLGTRDHLPDTKVVSVPETTFVSGSSTFTGAAALAAASAAENGGETKSKDKDGLSSFAIIGIVGGVLVFFIVLYIAWFQWRKRRNRKDLERIDDLDGGFSPTSTKFDPYNLGNEKPKNHSGFDFIDEPLSSWRSQKSRHKSAGAGPVVNPFTDNNAERASPGRERVIVNQTEADADYQRRLETEYTETWYSDPGEAGLGTANALSAKRTQSWFGPEMAAMTDMGGDRRPSYIDGPQSIYHETNDPTNPNAHTWTEVSPSARSPQSAKSTTSNRVPAPPDPPLPAAYQGQSLSRSQSQSPRTKKNARPETDFSCGDFYQGYDHSRPGTEYTQFTHEPPLETSFTQMHTPATSTMLPWLSKNDAPPPIPVKGPVNPTTLPNQPQRKETGGFGFGSPPKVLLRSPPSAAMAQKPDVQNKGWLGVIPTFR